MSYYTSITILIWLALGILCILVLENARLQARKKILLYQTCALIALAALSEWLGVRMDGSAAPWLLRTIKCVDYVLTPISGGLLVAMLSGRDSRWRRMLFIILVINAVFQLAALFTGWMVAVDGQNHYAHGRLYFIYVVIYLVVVALVVAEFIHYGQNFRRQNRISLYGILLLVVAGIAMQELSGSEYRTAYLALALGMILLYIHGTEYSQLAADDQLQEQRIQITADALTGVWSRYAYSRALKDMNEKGVPQDLAVFSIDIDGLKEVNDSLGHEAGDELICGAANCITAAFGKTGRCYRTGGDEFVVLANMAGEQTEEAMARLTWQTAKWHGEIVQELHLSVGCATASQHPGLSAEKLVGVADLAMYAEKTAYYRHLGIDRRHPQEKMFEIPSQTAEYNNEEEPS